MSNNFQWEDDAEEFRDQPDEIQIDKSTGRQVEAPPVSVRAQRPAAPAKPAAPQKVAQPETPTYEEIQEEQEEEDFSTVLSDARLRLEQGRLYEMIMNNDLFEGTEADPVAVKSVQKQIRNFAKERMEIMLGMRQEPSQEAIVSSPFNDLEVEALKALASAATKGATQAPEAQTFSGAQVKTAVRQGLKPINLQGSKSAQATKTVAKPLAQKPTQPVVRKKNDATVEQILAEEGVSREELETTFDPNYKPLSKPIHQMTEQEIIERNKRARAGKAVPSNSAIPMPSPQQEEQMYAARAMTAAAHPQMQTIMNLLNQQSAKK